jgi:asparagine synthase (glutamine-hydrolysing)
MCGIVTYLGRDASAGLAFVGRALGKLAHRGPDDEGLYEGSGAVLGHRRLSIVDLTEAGHQPMVSPDGRWVIVYNGEVYNHLDLRERLCRGWEFRSRTDSETVLAALALHGPSALEDMVGMWALALWDAHERRLLVSRDRYGQKPLYWRAHGDGSVRFASEIAPLLDEGERPAMYAPAVAEYLATGNYGHLGERTFFDDVYSFPPAHWAHVALGQARPEPRRYWRFPWRDESERRPFDGVASRRFRDAFEEAVGSQLMSDVPLGATLSGGLDSSAVVGAMASRAGNGSIPVFFAKASGGPFDESRYVDAVVDRWPGRLVLHPVAVGRMRLSTILPETLRVQEEPFGDPSIAAHGLLMERAREVGVPVVLGGQGGDEILLGYPHLGHAILSSSMRAGNLRWAIAEARALSVGRATFARIALSSVLPAAERAARRRSRRRRNAWLSPALRAAVADEIVELSSMSDLEGTWIENLERFALPHLTHYDDRSGMARSIEGRMPFLDHRLADVVAGIDPKEFVKAGRLKHLLRESCGDLLPEPVLTRRDKIGFYTPMGDLLRAESEWVRSRIADDVAREIDVYAMPTVVAALDSLSSGAPARPDAAHVVWRSLSVRLWAEQFGAQRWRPA